MRAKAWTFGTAGMGGVVLGLLLAGTPASAAAESAAWRSEWPRTDFTKHTVAVDEIVSGGPSKDGIPAIDRPRFVPVAGAKGLADTEPVIALTVGADSRAYPLRVLMWHEIVNDTVGGTPVTITYCPLCNAAIVFDRRLDGRVLDFGTTGKLRKSDLVMYDRQTESWWQQFLGEAIVGELSGRRLEMLPSRLESLGRFRARAPGGVVLVPAEPSLRPYGINPYAYYDSARRPFLYRGELPAGIEPMMRVVAVGNQAWTLALLREQGVIRHGDIEIRWEAGQNSALDAPEIAAGKDVGNIIVQRRRGDAVEDVLHHVTFAFVFYAFTPEGTIHR